MRKLLALLYYVHTNTYNQINWKFLRVLIMHFYRMGPFHTRRRFCTRLYVRVPDSGHPVIYVRQFCKNKPGHKICRCMSARSTRHYTLIHNPTILHMKTFFAPSCHPRKKIFSKKKLSHSCLTRHCPLQNIIQTKILVKTSPPLLL